MTSRGTRIWRWLAGVAAALVILAALAVGAFRLALELLPEYEAQVAANVREATGLQLSFDALDARLGRYGPEIFFEGARIIGPDGSDVIVSARAGRASLAPLRSLFYRRLEIGRVVLEGPRLNFVIFPDRRIELVGQAWLSQPDTVRQEQRGLERIPRGRIEVRDASVGFLDLRANRAAWELQGVDVEMHRKGSTVTLSGRVRLPKHLGTSLEFDAEVAGDLAEPRSLSWQGRVAGRDVDFAGWVDLLPETFTLPAAGRGSLRVGARAERGVLQGGRVVVELADVVLPTPDDRPAAMYRRLGGELVAERDGDTWRVRGEDVEMSLADSPWEPTDLAADIVREDGQWVSARVKAGFIRLENLAPLLALAPASVVRERLDSLALRGRLHGTDLEFTRSAGRILPDVTGRVLFEDVGFAPRGRFPGVTGLDGQLSGAGPTGVVTLTARDVAIDWPAEWRTVVPLARINANAEWSPGPGGVRVWIEDALVDAGHAQAAGRVRLLLRPGETPLLDVTAQASVADLSAVSRYIPTSRIGEKPLAWLDAAFVAGRVPRAEVQITGPARGFPYREGQGRFAGTARGEAVTLQFAPDWQPLVGLDVTAYFRGAAMTAEASRAAIGEVTMGEAIAEMDDWRESRLVVRANARGDAAAVLSLLQESPLREALGETFGRLTGTGPLLGELVMYLPFKEFAQRSVTVRALADGITLALPGVDEPLTDLRGAIWIRNREVQAPDLAGRFLGGPLRARVATTVARGGELVTTADFNGTLEGARLPAVVRLPLQSGLAGRTTWRGSWTAFRPAEPGVPARTRVRLDSDLKGLASGLPAPLAKPAEESRPLRIEADLDGAGAALARVGLGANLRGLVEYRLLDKKYALARGVLRLGGGEVAALPVGPGLRIDGRVPVLSVSDLAELSWDKPASRPLEDQLSSVTLEVGRLEVLGHEFERVNVDLRPGNRVWNLRVSAPAAQGRLSVPYRFPGDAPLVADFDRLVVAERVRPAAGEPDPRRLPAMRLDIRDLNLAGRTLGHVRTDAELVPDGLVFTRVVIEHPAFTLRGSGDWLAAAAGPRSTLAFELSSSDVKRFLLALAFEPLIDAREGTMAADLSWPGGPDADVPARVTGKARIALAKGRMVSVEPGAGRLLGLLSVAHLPRRLALDFKDLTGQGMAFDSISGDFTLASGEAYTDNLTLRGPAAEIGIAGRTSLRERTYDQTAVVTGDVGATLGVAGALAGGPAVGAALLLFSQIFKEPLKGVARGYYRITGPWEEPIVRKIDARELEDAAGLSRPPQASGAGAP